MKFHINGMGIDIRHLQRQSKFFNAVLQVVLGLSSHYAMQHKVENMPHHYVGMPGGVTV